MSKKDNEILKSFSADKKMTIELAKHYIFNFDYCLGLFGKEILAKQLENFNFSDFYSLDFLPVDAFAAKEYPHSATDLNQTDTLNKYRKKKIEISELTRKYLDVSDNEWNDEISDYDSYYTFVEGYFVKVPKFNRFHSIYYKCFKESFPYLTNFTFTIYWETELIFIECELDNGKYRQPLYVPFEALKLNDFGLIERKMNTYFKDYFAKHAKDGIVTGNLDFSTIEEALFSLSTPTCERLKNILENNAAVTR